MYSVPGSTVKEQTKLARMERDRGVRPLLPLTPPSFAEQGPVDPLNLDPSENSEDHCGDAQLVVDDAEWLQTLEDEVAAGYALVQQCIDNTRNVSSQLQQPSNTVSSNVVPVVSSSICAGRQNRTVVGSLSDSGTHNRSVVSRYIDQQKRRMSVFASAEDPVRHNRPVVSSIIAPGRSRMSVVGSVADPGSSSMSVVASAAAPIRHNRPVVSSIIAPGVAV